LFPPTTRARISSCSREESDEDFLRREEGSVCPRWEARTELIRRLEKAD